MRAQFTILLTSITLAIFAQPSLRTDYSLFTDSCPSPAKYRIASRKMYTTCTDSVRYCPDDTISEYYDRSGNLVAEIHREPNLHWRNLFDLQEHYFFYDSQGRIRLDSTVNNGKLHTLVYTYVPAERRAIIYENEFGVSTATVVQYDEHNQEISRLTVDENRDTTLLAYAHGDTFTHVRYFHYEGVTTTQDSISEIRTGNKVSTFIGYPYLSPESTTRVKYYDNQGKLTDDVQYYNLIYLSDSAHLEYDKKGRLIRRTHIFPKVYIGEDSAIRTWISEYTYNKKGQLVQIRSWEKSTPDKVYTTCKVYNEKGLCVEQQSLVRNAVGKDVLWSVRRWEYGYY